MPYSTHQVIYHWITVALILGLVGSGLAYSFELANAGAIRAHQIMGQVLILVIVLRLVARLRRPPSEPEGHEAWELRLAVVTHWALYALILVFLVTGYVSASALRDPALLAPVGLAFARSDTGEILLEMHYAAKWALLALVGMHIAGAVKHAVIDRDGSFSRMWFSQT
ncbi:MAG: cytochrome b/b6 domain-containing protein [Pseudomonadota bacterium]